MIKRIGPTSATQTDPSIIWVDDAGVAKQRTPMELVMESKGATLGAVAKSVNFAHALRQVSKKQLDHAFGEFYRGLILLQNYSTLNAKATEKILKKHDKNIGLKTKEAFMKETVIKYDFYKYSDLNTLISEVEVNSKRNISVNYSWYIHQHFVEGIEEEQ